MQFTDVSGLAGIAVAMAALAARLPGIATLAPLRRLPFLLFVAAASLLPLDGLSAAAYVRGVSGDLSIASVLLLSSFVATSLLRSPPSEAAARLSRLTLQATLALAALLLYPLALGIGRFDPYRLGYGDPGFVGAVLLLALAFCWRRFYLPALCLALSVLAWAVGWYESGNLWDYLIDPLVAVYALLAIALRLRRS